MLSLIGCGGEGRRRFEKRRITGRSGGGGEVPSVGGGVVCGVWEEALGVGDERDVGVVG